MNLTVGFSRSSSSGFKCKQYVFIVNDQEARWKDQAVNCVLITRAFP